MTDFDALEPIPELSAIDAATLADEIVPNHRPVLVRGQFRDWPIVNRFRDGEGEDYVRSFAESHAVQAFRGSGDMHGRYFYSDDFRGVNFERIELPLGVLLDELRADADRDGPVPLYAGAIPLKGPLSGLLEENANRLLPSSVEQLSSLWIGNRGVTATHYDLPQNIAVVVAGRRRFTLFPPEQLDNLYLGPLDNTLAGQPISMVHLHEPDFGRFPRFRDALNAAMTAVLEPGDVLYLPSMWFHNVESLDRLGVLVNFWWRDAAAHMFTPMFTMLHAMLSIKGLPEYEKECWHRMFEQYVFETNGDPMAHLPEHARGFFGEMTPEKVARLRLYLLHSLGGKPR